MKIFFIALFAFLGFFLARGPMNELHAQPKAENLRVKKLFDAMRDGTYAEKVEFPRLDMTDVPALLELADSTKVLKKFPTNPLSSQLELQCSEGMVALWLIEGVRQGSKGIKYPSLNALCFKDDVQAKNYTEESEANHKEVAKAYRAWWNKAKGLSAEKAKELDPLKGTNLHWR